MAFGRAEQSRFGQSNSKLAVAAECVIRSHHGSMAHHKPTTRYDARYANPHLNQYRYHYEISFQRETDTQRKN
jgi:hypothetical protein